MDEMFLSIQVVRDIYFLLLETNCSVQKKSVITRPEQTGEVVMEGVLAQTLGVRLAAKGEGVKKGLIGSLSHAKESMLA